MQITAAQCRAARALIEWSQNDLSAASSVAKATIANFEAGNRSPYARTLDDIMRALETAGVVFLAEGQEASGGPGVRLTASDISQAGASQASVRRRRPVENDNQEHDKEADRHEVNE